MCNFEHIRTNEENEEVIAKLEQVTCMPIETIVNLFAAGYTLQSPKHLNTSMSGHYVRCPVKTEYTWKDIVKIGEEIYFVKAKISGEMDSPDIYRIDDFIETVAEKYGVDTDDVHLWTMEHFDIPVATVTDCGCYINGVPEWLLNE